MNKKFSAETDFLCETKNGGIVICRYIGNEEIINIPPTISGKPVVEVGFSSFRCNTSIKAVCLPNTVTTIAPFAFDWCKNLEKVEGEGVESIGGHAFANTAIKIFEVGKVVNFIEDDAFIDAGLLEEIKVDEENENFSSIGGVLYDKNVYELIKYPEGKMDERYKMPNSVHFVGQRACSNTLFTEIEFSEEVTLIENEAFFRSSVIEVEVPFACYYVGIKAFSECDNLKSIWFPNAKELGKGCCRFSTHLESAYFGVNITEIPNEMFEKCFCLNYVEIDGITKVGNKAFSECYRLPEIDLEKVTFIGGSAFNDCESLEAIDLTSIETLRYKAFNKCYKLRQVRLSKNFFELNAGVFKNCFSLDDINLERVMSYAADSLLNAGTEDTEFKFHPQAKCKDCAA